MSKKIRETIAMVLIVVVFMGMLGVCGYVETHYTRKDCVVVETEGQLVTVEDKVGYVWCYEAEGDVPTVGTVVDVHMYTAHTDSYIYDDEIVGVSVQ